MLTGERCRVSLPCFGVCCRRILAFGSAFWISEALLLRPAEARLGERPGAIANPSRVVPVVPLILVHAL